MKKKQEGKKVNEPKGNYTLPFEYMDTVKMSRHLNVLLSMMTNIIVKFVPKQKLKEAVLQGGMDEGYANTTLKMVKYSRVFSHITGKILGFEDDKLRDEVRTDVAKCAAMFFAISTPDESANPKKSKKPSTKKARAK